MVVISDFPEDISQAAVASLAGDADEYFDDHCALVIARALLAERNRTITMMLARSNKLRGATLRLRRDALTNRIETEKARF